MRHFPTIFVWLVTLFDRKLRSHCQIRLFRWFSNTVPQLGLASGDFPLARPLESFKNEWKKLKLERKCSLLVARLACRFFGSCPRFGNSHQPCGRSTGSAASCSWELSWDSLAWSAWKILSSDQRCVTNAVDSDSRVKQSFRISEPQKCDFWSPKFLPSRNL